MEQIMEHIKGHIAKLEPYKKPYTPPPQQSGVLIRSMSILSRATDLVDEVQENRVILNQFYQNISPYNDIVKKIFEDKGLTTPALICYANENEEYMSKILSEIQEGIDNSQMNSNIDEKNFKKELLEVLRLNETDYEFEKLWKGIFPNFNINNRKKLKQQYDNVTFMNFKELLKDPFQNGLYHHNTFGWRSKRSSSDYDRLIKYIEETE